MCLHDMLKMSGLQRMTQHECIHAHERMTSNVQVTGPFPSPAPHLATIEIQTKSEANHTPQETHSLLHVVHGKHDFCSKTAPNMVLCR